MSESGRKVGRSGRRAVDLVHDLVDQPASVVARRQEVYVTKSRAAIRRLTICSLHCTYASAVLPLCL